MREGHAADRPRFGAQSSSAELAAAAGLRSSSRNCSDRGAAASAVDSSSPSRAVTRRQFPPRTCPAEPATQPEASQLIGGDTRPISQQTARSAQPAMHSAAEGAPATRTLFTAGCSARQHPDSVSAFGQAGDRAMRSQQGEVDDGPSGQAAEHGDEHSGQTISVGRQPRSRRRLKSTAAGRRTQTLPGVRAWAGWQRAIRTGSNGSAAATSALLAMCALCVAGLAGAATAAAPPVVRAAVAGNAATSSAILVRAAHRLRHSHRRQPTAVPPLPSASLETCCPECI